ncbi:ABC transporter permease [Bifidobacterium aemilianum]|uniref:ABC transporter permease n=2 Tax=Bifidobacterium aemilianum TaxID=2493120 RepID=A0A366KAB0_9BIFI|nr:ABC transporter permease [Bifidobacterium aemilianum]
MVGLLAPIFAALLTSRLAVLETSERMNLTWLSLGQSDLSRFWCKLLVSGTALGLCFLLPLCWIPLAAQAMGFGRSGSLASLLVLPACIAFLSCLAVSALQLVISLLVDRQAVGLGVGVIAGLVGSGLGPMGLPWLGWLFPAGISSAANPFQVQATADGYAQVSLRSHGWGLLGASLLACLFWVLVSSMLIKVKEAQR